MIRQLIGLIWVLGLVGCSAIEMNQQQAQATQQTENDIAQTVESRVQQTDVAMNATYDVARTEIASTLQALDVQAEDMTSAEFDLSTQIAQATMVMADLINTEMASTPEPDRESTAEVTPDLLTDTLPTDAEITLYGSVPIDSDSLNSITALALDADGYLLVSLRSGEIYQLQDTDDDGSADETILIYDDADNELSQVSGLFVDGTALYVLNGDQLSQLQDSDDDGVYDTVAHLSDELPANQALLQANNSIIRSPDGRYFTADVNTGDILVVTLGS